jgi:ribosomal protein L9
VKLILLRDARIRHKAGEVVEVTGAEAEFLLSTRSAIPAKTAAEKTEEKPARAKRVKK